MLIKNRIKINSIWICIIIFFITFNNYNCFSRDNLENKCTLGKFKCKSENKCIPVELYQNGEVDCVDGSDEECNRNQFKCNCGFPVCISKEKVGDKRADCTDNSDEGPSIKRICDQVSSLRHKRNAKGPTKEIYRASASVVKEVRKPSSSSSSSLSARRKLKESKGSNRYKIEGFQKRKLHQYIDDFNINYAPPSDVANEFGVVNYPSAPVNQPGQPEFVNVNNEAFVPYNQQPPPPANNFHRVRVPEPFNIQPAGFNQRRPDLPNNVRFQRVAVRRPANSDQPLTRGPNGGTFRRVPVFANPSEDLSPPQNQPIPVQARPQGRRKFKRVRPGQPQSQNADGRRPAKRIKITLPLTEIETPNAINNREPTNENVAETPDISQASPQPQLPPIETTSAPTRRIIRIKKPLKPGTSPRRIVLKGSRVPLNQLDSRPTQPEEEVSHNNALDNGENLSDDNNKLNNEVPSAKPGKQHPDHVLVHYLTRYTYMTTVIRGPHTLFTTRESTASSIATSSVDARLLGVLQKSKNGQTNPTIVNLGTQTKGPTTTVVNLKTDISIENIEPLRIEPTKAVSKKEQLSTETIQVVRKPVLESYQANSASKINLNQLDKIDKTFYTQFKYYYTVYDEKSTKQSTRDEVISTTLNSPVNLASAGLGRNVDADGFLTLGSGPETVNLGKRAFGGVTTEVNLAMQSYVKLAGVSNAVIEPLSTSSPEDSFKQQSSGSPQSTPGFQIEASFTGSQSLSSSLATPDIETSKVETVRKTRKPVRVTNTEPIREVIRSRVLISGRPGVRVRSRPVSRIQINRTPTVSLELSSPVLTVESPTPSVVASNFQVEPTTTENVEVESSSVRPGVVRRPFNRFRSKKPTRVQGSNDPKFVVVTRSGPVGSIRPSNSRFRVASRVVRPASASSELFTTASAFPVPSGPPSREPLPLPTTTINDRGETVAVTVTTVPVIFGLETSYRTLTLSSTLTPYLASTQSLPKSLPTSSTYYVTKTHTVPFTIGGKTLYTTFEIVESTVGLETQPSNEPYGRANRFTKASNGVTLIVTKSTDNRIEPTSALTLQPTLITGASVMMKDQHLKPIKPAGSDTLTLYTTYTYFTTFYQGSSSIISSSEKIISNLITIPATDLPSKITPSSSSAYAPSPYTLVETSEKIEKSTIYSTMTFFATLYNGTQSTITPIEETKTEVLTLREPIKITRTVYPSASFVPHQQSVFTRTYYTTYTNLVTFFENNIPTTSEIKETVSNIITFTVPGSEATRPFYDQPVSSYEPKPSSQIKPAPQLTTRSTQTTLTHYITLFSGSNTILSSIEEVSPTVVTEVVGATQAPSQIKPSLYQRPNTGAENNEPYPVISRDIMTAFVPSISTLYTTHTLYTTFFSGTTSIISSTIQTTSSLVTLYVPYSVIAAASSIANIPKSSDQVLTLLTTYTTTTTGLDSLVSRFESTATNYITIQPTATAGIEQLFSTDIYSPYLESSQHPSFRIESSRFDELESSFASGYSDTPAMTTRLPEEALSSSFLFSSAVLNSAATTTVIDGSTVVLLTNVVFKPDVEPTSVIDLASSSILDNHVAKGPIGQDANSLHDHTDSTTFIDQLVNDKQKITTDPISAVMYNTDLPTSSLHEAIIPTSAIKDGPYQTLPSPNAAVPDKNTIQPSVIELSDLLSGSTSALNANIGAAIKDIVQLIKVGANKLSQSSSKNNTNQINRNEGAKITLPSGVITSKDSKEPVYIPIGAIGRNETLSPENEPAVVPVYTPPKTTEKPAPTTRVIESPTYIANGAETTEIPLNPVYQPIYPFRPKGNLKRPSASNVPSHKKKESGPQESKIESSIQTLNINDETIKIQSTPSLILQTSNPDISENKNKGLYTQISSGATTLFLVDASNANANGGQSVDQKTKYITSVESITRTLTLTTTKVYYTRDSPLTITSEFTTTIPPRTFVSTIIGSRTILGTAGEASKTIVDIEPTKAKGTEQTTYVTTTTLIFNSITTTVVKTLVIPTAIDPSKPVSVSPSTASAPSTSGRIPNRPTRKPILPFKGRVRQSTPPPVVSIRPPASRPKVPFIPKRFSTPRPVTEPYVPITFKPIAVNDTKSNPLDDDQCRPACNNANNEICKETNGKYKCECRPGFAKKNSSVICEEMQSYTVILRVMKVNETPIDFKPEFNNKKSDEYKELAKITVDEIDKAYKTTLVKDNYIGSDVKAIKKPYNNGNGVLVNLTVHLSDSESLNEQVLQNELSKSLDSVLDESESIPVPASIVISAEVENVADFDECSDLAYNDCDPTAKCINEIGSYKCECQNGFPDMNPSLPGRSCASEIKNCDHCHNRGDCIRDENSDGPACKCHRMYLGKQCEINGILLATVLPVAAVLSIISVCCIVYCCRKYKKRSNYQKGFKNIVSFAPPTIGASTLDRKAMLETSSEGSEHFRHGYEGPGVAGDPGSSSRRHRMDPSMERAMAMGGGSYSIPPQVVIPRARHPNQVNYAIHRGQVYMW